MSSDEEDSVVEEVDVYLSRQLSDNLVLLQYPVRPNHVTYDTVQHLSAKVKPKQLRLEMELDMNTKSANYARSKGEQIALNVDGLDPGEKATYMSDKMDKQVIRSWPVGTSTSRFTLGTFRDKELHLTPLRGVLQMRPDFSYLDKADLKITKEQEANETEDEEPEVKHVMVKFAHTESEDAKNRRMASYDYLKKEEDKEKWISINYHQMESSLAESERCLLYAQISNNTSEFYLNQEDYLQRLIPKEVSEEEGKPAMPNNVLSITELKTMALGDQVKALLRSAKVIRFTQLMSLLPKGSEATAVLRFVQQVALLVQGCWVVKSEVLYPKDSFSAHSGVPAETLCKGRDYIMWKFLLHRYLFRKDIASVIKLPAEDVKDILDHMAKFRVHKGWEFLMDYDQEFVNRHIEVAQRQQMLWDRKFQQLSLSLNVTKADVKQAANATTVVATSPKRRRTTSRSRTKSGSEMSMSDMSDADVEMKDGRQHHHSGSDRRHRNSSGTSRKLPIVIATENGMDIDPVVSPHHEPADHNGTSVDPGALKLELLQFAVERLRSRYVLSMSDCRRLFMMKLAECPPGHILGSGVSDKQLEQSMLEAGAHKLASGPNTESIFILDKVGDGRDDLREILVKLFEEKSHVRLTMFRKRLEETGQEMPSDNDLRKLLKDYCVPKGATWTLKCTLQEDT